MSSDGHVGKDQGAIGDRDKVDRIAAAMEGVIELLDAYANELDAELARLDPDAHANLIKMLHYQIPEVKACLDRMETDALEHVRLMKDKAFWVQKARAGLLF